MLKRTLFIFSLCTSWCASAQAEETAVDAPATIAADTGTHMTLEETLLITLENSRSLQIEKLDPRIVVESEDIALAEFDPNIGASVSYNIDRVNPDAGSSQRADDVGAQAIVSKKFATGTRVELVGEVGRDEPLSGGTDGRRYTDSAGGELRLTQALMEGRGRGVNLVNVRKARVNTAISNQQLRRYVETLAYTVSVAYWNLFVEQQKLKVYEGSYELALKHEKEVEVFIKNGKLPEIEIATVKGEVSARWERVIFSRGAIDKARLNLISIMNYYSIAADGWDQQIVPIDDPRHMYQAPDDVVSYVDVALLKRPEVEEAHLKIRRYQLEVVATKNGLLPKLDFFISMGHTEYSDSFDTKRDIDSDEQYVRFGLEYSYGVGRRAERARYSQSMLLQEQSQLALDNLRELIQREVRQAYVDCTTSHKTIEAVSVTQELRNQALKTQTIKFELGKATNTDIANAQRDLLLSQINHTEAVVDYVKDRLRLHYLDGSLIERSGLVLPQF